MWPRKKNEDERSKVMVTEVKLPEPAPTPIEIVAHKNASKKETNKVKKANKYIRDIFQDNHFSITVHIAVGGKIKQSKGHS